MIGRRRHPIDIKEAAQTFTAYLAIPVALFYPAGFLALWLQFSNYYDFTLGTAWQAVSLVDRTAVVGQGAAILTVALITSVVFSWLVGRILLWTEVPARIVSTRDKILRFAALLGLSLSAGVFFILYSRVLHSGYLSVQTTSPNIGVDFALLRNRDCSRWVINYLEQKDNLDYWPDTVLPALLFITGGLVGGYLMYRSYRRFHDNLRAEVRTEELRPKIELYSVLYQPSRFFTFFREGVVDGWIYSGLVATYLLSVTSVVVLAFFLQVTLPYMWYTTTVAVDQGSMRQGTESGEGAGRLLSHSNGYWYVISQPVCRSASGKPYKKQGERQYHYRSIMAIPDRNAVDVEILDRY